MTLCFWSATVSKSLNRFRDSTIMQFKWTVNTKDFTNPKCVFCLSCTILNLYHFSCLTLFKAAIFVRMIIRKRIRQFLKNPGKPHRYWVFRSLLFNFWQNRNRFLLIFTIKLPQIKDPTAKADFACPAAGSHARAITTIRCRAWKPPTLNSPVKTDKAASTELWVGE